MKHFTNWEMETGGRGLCFTQGQEKLVVNLYLGNVQFPNISLFGTIYSNSRFQMQYAGCQYMHCSEMGPTVVQKNSATINK